MCPCTLPLFLFLKKETWLYPRYHHPSTHTQPDHSNPEIHTLIYTETSGETDDKPRPSRVGRRSGFRKQRKKWGKSGDTAYWDKTFTTGEAMVPPFTVVAVT